MGRSATRGGGRGVIRVMADLSGRSLAVIVGSNPTGGMDICCEYLRRADHSSRGVLPSVVCLSVITNPR